MHLFSINASFEQLNKIKYISISVKKKNISACEVLEYYMFNYKY